LLKVTASVSALNQPRRATAKIGHEKHKKAQEDRAAHARTGTAIHFPLFVLFCVFRGYTAFLPNSAEGVVRPPGNVVLPL
jgi:hypothetical protein